MTIKATHEKAYCNCLAVERGLKAVGHADSFESAIVVEAPLPWKLDMMQNAGPLPEEIIRLLALWMARYRAGEGYPHRLMVVAPDTRCSVEGHRRVMCYTRPTGMMAQLDKVEYLVPEDKVGPLIWSLYEGRDSLVQFDACLVPDAEAYRDILVCTHGTVDAACAKFGFPLYKHMRDIYGDEHLRVWRVSHFGGHVFAPTLMDMPTGHYWAYVGKEQAGQIIERAGDVSVIQPYYRGWAGLEGGFLQTAEAALWQQYGWAWFDYPRSGEVMALDDADNPQWAQVQLRYGIPGEAVVITEMRVEVDTVIETETSTGKDHTYAYPQYSVVHRPL